MRTAKTVRPLNDGVPYSVPSRATRRLGVGAAELVVSYRFIGRRRELALATEALDSAEVGAGNVLVVAGAAGIGKSRLAREIASTARARGMNVAWSAGWPGPGAAPYWPWPQVLSAIDPGGAPAAEIDTLIQAPERFDHFAAVGERVLALSAERPVVIVLDDAHLIDADGLLLARYVGRAAAGRRLLLLLTHRVGAEVPPSSAEVLADIGRDGTVVELRGLRMDEVTELMQAHGEAGNAALTDRVCRLTDGNPFLVEQVLEAGVEERFHLLSKPVRELLDGPLEALDAPTVRVLDAAAVLGPRATARELMQVAGIDRSQLESSWNLSLKSGVARPQTSSSFAFTHELFREAVLARMTAQQLADMHQRSLAAIDERVPSVELALRRARHALAIAGLAPEQASGAIEIVRNSASVLLTHGSPEAAAALLLDTCAAIEAAGSRAAPDLLCQLGEALIATGRLAEARPVFERAVAGASDAGDSITYAVAALGLGGVWVHEHRGDEAWRRYIGILRQAMARLDGLGTTASELLLARLRVRLAAELAVVGAGTVAAVEAALQPLRSARQPAHLAAGLSLLLHTMLGPEHATRRAAIAEELRVAAREAGDELQTLIGLLWHAVNALLCGLNADRELTALRERADALNMRAILFVADAIDAMRLMRAGDLAAAEVAAEACYRRGLDVGDADAATYHAAHELALAWYTGTTGGMAGVAEQLAAEAATPVENPVFMAVFAALAARAGDRDRAERALAAVGRGRLRELATGSSWLLTLAALVEAAASLDDVALAEEAYALMEPYRSLPVMGSLGICCVGSAERYLGLAARVAGRLDASVAHLQSAVHANQRLGNWPLTAIARGDLAETLLQRGHRADRAAAAAALSTALEAAEQMGLSGRIAHLKALQTRMEAVAMEAEASFIRDGVAWEIAIRDESVRVAHSVGMDYLADLLAAPGTTISSSRLAGLDATAAPQDVVDRETLVSVRRRMNQLKAEIHTAERTGDHGRADALERELEQLTMHLRTAAHRGRSKHFADNSERARTSVQKAIRRALDAIEAKSPRLAGTLRGSIQTGYQCSYQPGSDAPRRWHVASASEPMGSSGEQL